ncbi:helix-turn-helix transcriptional regulator [Geodermatophilus sabuli]|uniref:Transcriptional regulator, LuxR family n=1 Tax=Geodermatophilus sabuli TaxID=1564158 RepID=A0A285E7S9_9ACTN|nr:helix-turn-helix transcriptional regulator [Geodermatophilus sabuli]MBB3082053.1 DNA-binding CsgD family transcriptional regulator [Geodermatophilus sabuli]SNX95075.1 transcriptional regulator, LuxR family [Geodermatophilus sabuli]
MTPATPVLVARETELAVLEQLLQDGGLGPSLVRVTGAPGVGKTALVRQALERHPGPVLEGRGVPWEGSRPYAVLDQLLAGERVPPDPFSAAELVARRAAGTAGARAVVLVDDAHWSDPESLQALATAVRHQHRAAVTVVLVGPGAPVEAAPATLDVLLRSATATVALGPFSAEDVARLAAARGIPLSPAGAEHLWRHTGGVAGHVVALLEELPRETWTGRRPDLPAPAVVASRVRDQLVRCDREARALAEAVAVLGPAPVAEVAALADVGDLLAALDGAQRSGLLRPAGPGRPTELAPPDPLVAAAVLTAMGPAGVARAHRRAAEVVEDATRRIGHLVAASVGPDAALACDLDELARRRAAEGAWADASALLADASRLSEDRRSREDRLVRAVDALVGAGDAIGAAALVPEVESLRETPLRNAVLGYLAVVRGRAVEAETRLRRAWDLVNPARDPGAAALVSQRFVLHELAGCRAEELVAWADRTIELAGPDAPEALEAVAIRGLGVAGTGRPAEALAGYRAPSERVRSGAQAQRVQLGEGWLHLTLDEVAQAATELESAVPTTYLGGSHRISLWALGWLARARFLTGEWDAALGAVAQGGDLVARTGMVLVAPLLHWTGAQVNALRGDWDAAGRALRDAEAGSSDYPIMRVPSMLARAAVAEARADSAGVLRELEPLARNGPRGWVDEPGAWPWTDVYANALVLEGLLDEADAFLLPHERRAAERGHRSTGARLGSARGRWFGAHGDLDAAREAFRTSLGLLEQLPLRYDRARVTYAFGQTLRRAGKRREADAAISAARDGYLSLGAATCVARCDRELRAAGRGAGRAEERTDLLTPQEQTVSELVASGLSNREVAAELYVSEKTVQYHLTRIYTKLGVRSRAELAALRGRTPAT